MREELGARILTNARGKVAQASALQAVVPPASCEQLGVALSCDGGGPLSALDGRPRLALSSSCLSSASASAFCGVLGS
jgi:hypothetical protein